jgi:hypothetical protein
MKTSGCASGEKGLSSETEIFLRQYTSELKYGKIKIY